MRIEPDVWGNWLSSMEDIVIDKDVVRLKNFRAASSASSAASAKILDLLEKAGFQPPSKDELSEALSMSQKTVTDVLKLMGKEGTLMRINDSMSK